MQPHACCLPALALGAGSRAAEARPSALLQSLQTTAGHGKLVVDGTLYPKSYGTNVNEQCAPPLRCPSRPAPPAASTAAWEALPWSGAALRRAAGRPLLQEPAGRRQKSFPQPAKRLPRRYLEQFDLSNATRTAAINYAPLLPTPGLCVGTHSIAYSNASQQCAPPRLSGRLAATASPALHSPCSRSAELSCGLWQPAGATAGTSLACCTACPSG